MLRIPKSLPLPSLLTEIAALRARIAELECGSAHWQPTTGQSHLFLIKLCAKDEPKKLTLPALQPGHKVSALSLPIPTKVEEAFKLYSLCAIYSTHTCGLDRSSELSIVTVDWIGAAKAAEERTLHYWGADRASALMSHHLVVLDIGRTHGCGNWPTRTTNTTLQDST
ncbi:hypothetical protein EDB19DRAFT_2032516 [Suillus lakei]|nr:hypothetical protein EDB19DRAFT_2032516 [Suillus lakei]